MWVLVVAQWKRMARKCFLHLERNSLRVEAQVLQRASRPGNVVAGTAVTDERAWPELWNHQLKREPYLH